MLRRALMTLSGSERTRDAVMSAGMTREVVERFIAGSEAIDAIDVARRLSGSGRLVTIDHLGEDTTDRAQAEAARDAYLLLLGLIADTGLADTTEVSVKLSAMGQALGADGHAIATDHAHAICAAARAAGTTVTLDMEDHTTTDLTLATAEQLWPDFPDLGVVLQAGLHRTETDCRDLARRGVRIRLCKGAYDEPESVAYRHRRAVARAYVRCLNVLLAGDCYPMVATHDPTLVDVAAALAIRHGRAKGEYEFQMLFGVRTDEQERLAAEGERMRVYVPYGVDWWGYMVRRMAEKPANLGLFLRALTD